MKHLFKPVRQEMPGRLHLLLLLAAIACQHTASCASRLQVNSEQRFVDLLITADEAYISSAAVIEQLKAFLANLSAYLAEATEAAGRRLSFARVRLLVPRSRADMLRQAGYTLTPATWESVAGADIQVDSRRADQGSVLHGGGCGEAGQRIYMPGYLMRPGTLGHIVLARHFAQFRWGVLPETGVNGQKFYLYAEKFQPVMCSQAIPGRYQVTQGGETFTTINPCIREVNGTLTLADSCSFIADTTSTGVFASLMSGYGSLPHVKRFCDSAASGAEAAMRHNQYAPTLHTRMCGLRSTAEVARQHADFAGGSGGGSAATAPELLLVEPPVSRKIVLMLDISGSMIGNRLLNMVTAASRYVTYFIEPGAQVAIAAFNESVQILEPLRTINSLADRQLLADSVRRLMAAGWTNIAEAIRGSMQILGAGSPYNSSQSGWVVLLTDGEHNINDASVEAAIAAASQTSIVFDTVCFSNESDRRLAQLSSSTGGWAMFSSANASVPVTSELDTAFAKLADRALGPNRTVLLSAGTFSLPMEPITLRVDESITTSLNFMLSFPDSNLAALNVTVKDPNGVVYGSFRGAEYYEANAALGSVVVKIPDANIVVGTWTVYVTASSSVGRRRRDLHSSSASAQSGGSTGSVIVIGSLRGDSVGLSAWLRFANISEVTSSTVQLIFASVVNASGVALEGATLQATMGSPSGSVTVIGLKDDGLGFDAQANDGIYTGSVTGDQMSSPGDHSVTVSLLSPSRRVTSAGKFRVLSVPAGGAASLRPPPGRIVDLRVDFSVKRKQVRLQFTAPGDRAYSGNASAFELRASMQPDDLQSNFSSTQLISRIPGQLAGSLIDLSLGSNLFPDQFSNQSKTFYLSAVAVSGAGVSGEPALPVGAMFDYPNNWSDAPAPPATSQTIGAARVGRPLSILAFPWLLAFRVYF